MPEPLAMPAMRTSRPSIVTLRLAPFGKVSVVMIARAAPAMPPGASDAARSASFAVMRSCGSGSPITPVEAVKTRASGTPAARATASVMARTAATPPRPVKALELPELTRIAAPASEAPPSLASQSSTGAERVDERVSTPATTLPGASRISVTSVRPG